jgi:hypothetical protein
MQQQESTGRRSAPGGAADRAARWVAYGLLIYGALGVAFHLRWPAMLSAAAGSLTGALTFRDTPPELPGMDLPVAHYADRPWLPWACWLAGLALLAWRGVRAPQTPAAMPTTAPPAPRPPWRGDRRLILPALALLIVLALGAYARLDLLVPQARGLIERPYDDEGVYAGASQMMLQGILPYRDFFFAHPPLAALVYTPALAYHFTPWGSVTSFMIARYLSVAYSLGALLAMFAAGRLIGAGGALQGPARWRPLLFGTTAAAIWALDGRAIEINQKIMLDQPMILASMLALVCYLLAVRRLEEAGRRQWLLMAAGALAAVSMFTKIQGMACIAALGLDLLSRVRLRRPTGVPGARPADVWALGGGFAAVTLLAVGPFLVLAPCLFVRLVGFFQGFRPSDGVVLPPARIADLTSRLVNGPTVYLAALGFAVLTWWAARVVTGRAAAEENGALALWRPVVLWSFLSVLLFTYSRSFYNHYYVQLAAPLCLLGAAAWLPLLRPAPGRVAPARLSVPHPDSAGRQAGLKPAPTPPNARGRQLAVAGYAILLLPALALTLPAWQGFTTPAPDPIFATVARYANDAVPPGAAVLATDEQFDFLASRPPSHTSTGYLIDSYGHLIYLGLGLDTRSWDDLLAAAIHGTHSDDPYRVMWAPRAQADFLARARQAALVVLHERGFPRLRADTLAAVLADGMLREKKPSGCAPGDPVAQGGCRYVILAPQTAR